MNRRDQPCLSKISSKSKHWLQHLMENKRIFKKISWKLVIPAKGGALHEKDTLKVLQMNNSPTTEIYHCFQRKNPENRGRHSFKSSTPDEQFSNISTAHDEKRTIVASSFLLLFLKFSGLNSNSYFAVSKASSQYVSAFKLSVNRLFHYHVLCAHPSLLQDSRHFWATQTCRIFKCYTNISWKLIKTWALNEKDTLSTPDEQFTNYENLSFLSKKEPWK